MAYGNWGAFVYRNGERYKDGEDAPADLKNAGIGSSIAHAVLGTGDVIVCGYKCYGYVLSKQENGEWTLEAKTDADAADRVVWGEFDGYSFMINENEENFVKLDLTEPDGTKWTARCGFEYGAGHMDLEDDE